MQSSEVLRNPGTLLFAGFGLVLILTSGVAVTGLNAINGMLGRAALMSDLAAIQGPLGLVRELEKSFALSERSDIREELEHGVATITSLSESAARQAERTQYRAQLERIGSQAESYLASFYTAQGNDQGRGG